MNRCSFCEWIPILPWPVWPLAGQSLLGQNVVVGSMMVLLALCGSMPRGVYLGPHFRYECASPRLSAELPIFVHMYSMLKFFVLDVLLRRVVAVSGDPAPDSVFAPSFFGRPSGQLP